MGKTPGKTHPTTVKKKKVYLTFDADARKEYLTGFRKRRQERKDKGHEMLEKKLKQKIQAERNKRRKTTKEKVDKLLEGINLPGEGEGVGDQGAGESETVDFGTHEAVVTVCDFGDSGLVVAPNSHDSEEPNVISGVKRKGTNK